MALVTGGASGQGREYCRELFRQGCKVGGRFGGGGCGGPGVFVLCCGWGVCIMHAWGSDCMDVWM